MVADFKFKDSPRTLVRVPGSGWNRDPSAPAISCDLGWVSSLAATILINPYLPAVMTGSKFLVASRTNNLAKNKLATSQELNSMPGSAVGLSRRRPMNYEEKDETSQESKRPRLSVATPAGVTGPTVVEGTVPSTQGVAVPVVTQSSARQERPIVTARRTLPRPVPSGSRSMEELLEEQRQLQRMLLREFQRITLLQQERQRLLLEP
ncbi:hypothetical protein GWK47_050812 [Chionoecetes opilio]|uniref:Uncharacterized protein n=1 Tax=Chionoecetes opilio TaxID=41210 RepID=A0A8J5CSM0_CHIOP|nr:hypothetical protein GWK47_050812 [Chionoecetes opilio]